MDELANLDWLEKLAIELSRHHGDLSTLVREVQYHRRETDRLRARINQLQRALEVVLNPISGSVFEEFGHRYRPGKHSPEDVEYATRVCYGRESWPMDSWDDLVQAVQNLRASAAERDDTTVTVDRRAYRRFMEAYVFLRNGFAAPSDLK